MQQDSAEDGIGNGNTPPPLLVMWLLCFVAPHGVSFTGSLINPMFRGSNCVRNASNTKL